MRSIAVSCHLDQKQPVALAAVNRCKEAFKRTGSRAKRRKDGKCGPIIFPKRNTPRTIHDPRRCRKG